jgi:putative endonuclease
MSSKTGVLYTGVTNDLMRRTYEHKIKTTPGFTKQYNVKRLLYFESFGDISMAIQREKEIKGWSRAKKIKLIETKNRDWNDLSSGWMKENDSSSNERK